MLNSKRHFLNERNRLRSFKEKLSRWKNKRRRLETKIRPLIPRKKPKTRHRLGLTSRLKGLKMGTKTRRRERNQSPKKQCQLKNKPRWLSQSARWLRSKLRAFWTSSRNLRTRTSPWRFPSNWPSCLLKSVAHSRTTSRVASRKTSANANARNKMLSDASRKEKPRMQSSRNSFKLCEELLELAWLLRQQESLSLRQFRLFRTNNRFRKCNKLNKPNSLKFSSNSHMRLWTTRPFFNKWASIHRLGFLRLNWTNSRISKRWNSSRLKSNSSKLSKHRSLRCSRFLHRNLSSNHNLIRKCLSQIRPNFRPSWQVWRNQALTPK